MIKNDSGARFRPSPVLSGTGNCICAESFITNHKAQPGGRTRRQLDTAAYTALVMSAVSLGTVLAAGSMEGSLNVVPASVPTGLVEGTITQMLKTQTRIPFETVELLDENLPEGQTRVIVEGQSGLKTVTEEVTSVSGSELSRSILDIAYETPVSQIVSVGTKPLDPTASYGSYYYPANGTLTSRYGKRSTTVGSTNHKGIDIAGKLGDPIFAADGGSVVFAGVRGGYGKLVILQHDNGDLTYYGHNNRILVAEGQRVARGDTIAKMGATGTATGVHCHFELHPKGGAAANPLPALSEAPKSVVYV
jgi:murein DD-endopeptidase MepM/ murein hydrolase activator NlpD